MSDIVERLRNAYGPDHTNETLVETLPLEAADEIERLRREVQEARAKALEEAAVFVETHSYTFTSGSKNVYAMKPTHEKWRGADMQQKTVAAAIRALKDRAP